MGTNLDYAELLANANTSFREAFSQFFAGGPRGRFRRVSMVVPGGNAKTIDLNWLTKARPKVREWLGERYYEFPRAYDHSVTVRNWESTKAFHMNDLRYDAQDIIGLHINLFMSQSADDLYDDVIFGSGTDQFFQNSNTGPVGYDGVVLFSSSHPHGPNGSTQSNVTASAFTRSGMIAAIQAGKDLRTEDDKPMEIAYNHIEYATNMEEEVLDAIGATRAQGVAADGSLDSGTRVAAVAIENHTGASLTARHNPDYPDGVVDLIDTTKGVMPMILGEWRPPEPVTMDNADDVARFLRNEAWYGIEFDVAPKAGLWQVAHRFTG